MNFPQNFSKVTREVREVQRRFIGLVLWHLVMRDSPIFDPAAEEYVFIAKTAPNIDPNDEEERKLLVKTMGEKVRARLDGQSSEGFRKFR